MTTSSGNCRGWSGERKLIPEVIPRDFRNQLGDAAVECLNIHSDAVVTASALVDVVQSDWFGLAQ